jgi:hypothetical protein
VACYSDRPPKRPTQGADVSPRSAPTVGVLIAILLLWCQSALGASDFNGDGFSDLAIGSSTEDVDGTSDAGAVNVLYGSFAGLTSVGNRLLVQSSCSFGAPGYKDFFGEALATGNFNGDGFDDLAIGVPGEPVGGQPQAGEVDVMYGSAAGLTCDHSQARNQNSPGIQGTPELRDEFGLALTAGDFNGDGYDELAVGVPLEGHGDRSRAGVVHVLRGSSAGLTGPNQQWHQDVAGVAGIAEATDLFGRALAAGDFGRGAAREEDLAIGAPGEDIGDVEGAGAVEVIYGGGTGLTPSGSQVLHQDSPSVHGTSEPGDRFGLALAAADMGVDERADLAIGVPGEAIGGHAAAGAVSVLYGANISGLTGIGDQLLYPGGEGGLKGTPEKDDEFGRALAVADFGMSDVADLAIGVARDDNGAGVDAGAVHLMYGSRAGGVLTAGDQLIFAIGGNAVAGALRGGALTAGNFGKGPQADLAVGAVGGGVDGRRAGAVEVIYDGSLVETGRQRWHQNRQAILGVSEAGDRFGDAVAAG